MAKKKKRFPVKAFFYWLRYRIGEYCLRGFVAILPWIPRRLIMLFTLAAARLTFLLLWKYRKRMEENLSTAMGREFGTPEQQKSVVWRAWRNFAQGVYETSCTLYSSKQEICSWVAMEGEERLRRALQREKGVIALSAHLGNFTMIGARLAAAGYPFSAVVKQPKDRGFASLVDHYRAMVGVKTISAKPRREAARQILKALRRNEVILVIADEFKSGGVAVEFLGRTAPAPRGPVTLALRTGASVLPAFLTRDHEDRLTLHIGAEIDLIKSGDLQQDIAANASLFTRHLEAMVRRYPDQWNWLGFHRDGRRPRSEMVKAKTADTSEQDPFSL
ncbi:MAG: lysophospholipid acyltransferase family protein [Deltaproteobacteria bacterium]|nr:lysophospholipid acyltransferase family protein [Deltaproteobacteria bacterium]